MVLLAGIYYPEGYMTTWDAVIVGGGLAGLRAAIALRGLKVAVLSRVHPLRSHSVAAQGGINAALKNMPEGTDDSVEEHTYDTIKGSDFLADQVAAATLCEQAPRTVYEMEHWGTPFSRIDDGRIAQRPFGGTAVPRTCYAADRTGHHLLQTLYAQAKKHDITVFEEFVVLRLAQADGRVHGVVGIDLAAGSIVEFAARSVLFATGGYGRVFRDSTNALINTGGGIAIAYRAGVPIKDLEFVQFHPTTLFGTNILITEGARGEGGHLKNASGERFMSEYAPKLMELAPRDIVARAITTEINAGRGFPRGYVQLDLRHLGHDQIHEHLPGIWEIAHDFARVDACETALPVLPGQHYSMGGIDVDTEGRSAIRGFFACGECACISVHGANRLGGNSLLETLVFGRLTGEAMSRFLAESDQDIDDAAVVGAKAQIIDQIDRLAGGTFNAAMIRDRMRDILSDDVGIFREEKGLLSARDRIRQLAEDALQVKTDSSELRFNGGLITALELPMMLDLAMIICEGALARTESRGSHFRTDYALRDDQTWLKHTVAVEGSDGPRLEYRDVDLSRYEPQEREY
ncbi:MAG: FAD-dependent oxidoreductase [Planctomycetota bacterium]|jgi:succinate dehydrogenase / fumarate reductase flavoprotein subunit